MKFNKGFTLIELVIVVVILGFLAATALPKMVDLTDQAKKGNIQGMAGGFGSAVSLIRTQWEAEGRPNTAGKNVVSYDGLLLLLTNEVSSTPAVGTTPATKGIRPGYIVASVDGQNTGENLTNFTADNCVDIWQSVFQQPPRITASLADLNNDEYIDYFATTSGSGEDVLCHYYLKETLDKNTSDEYSDPIGVTTIGNSFTYKPSNSSIAIYVNI